MTNTETKLTVNRVNVLNTATEIFNLEARVPTLNEIREAFETPTSPAIAVYFSEWKILHADAIAQVKRTPAQMRDYCLRLQGELADLSTQFKALRQEKEEFKQWLVLNHPYILSEWSNYGVEAE